MGSSFAGVGMVHSERNEAARFHWIPTGSWLWKVRLRSQRKVSSRRSGGHNVFVVSACAPTDCGPDKISGTFYRKLGAGC